MVDAISGDEPADGRSRASAYSACVLGEDPGLLAHAPLVYLPVIVIGELEATFARGSRRAENEAMLAGSLMEPSCRSSTSAGCSSVWWLVGALRKARTPIRLE
jgi:hypothetical protein